MGSMKDDVTKLAASRQRGENADVQLRMMEPTFEVLQRRYYQELVNNTVADEKVDAQTVYKMVALNDIIVELKDTARRGRAASAKLEKQRLMNTGDGGV